MFNEMINIFKRYFKRFNRPTLDVTRDVTNYVNQTPERISVLGRFDETPTKLETQSFIK